VRTKGPKCPTPPDEGKGPERPDQSHKKNSSNRKDSDEGHREGGGLPTRSHGGEIKYAHMPPQGKQGAIASQPRDSNCKEERLFETKFSKGKNGGPTD